MKIALTKGRFALVDKEDYAWLSQYKWHFNGRYAVRITYQNGKKKNIWMHREIMKTPSDLFTDHINMDRLDNRKANLRVCTKSQNMHNRPAQHNNTSGVKGVYWDKARGKWCAEIKVLGKKHHIGRFLTKEEAARARANRSVELVKEFHQ